MTCCSSYSVSAGSEGARSATSGSMGARHGVAIGLERAGSFPSFAPLSCQKQRAGSRLGVFRSGGAIWLCLGGPRAPGHDIGVPRIISRDAVFIPKVVNVLKTSLS
jgi:hypothetical protein